MNFKAIVGLFKDTFKGWSEDKAARLGAALAYYTIFAIGPLLLISIAVAGLVFGQDAARGQVVGTVQGVVGKQGGEVIQTAIQNASKPSTSIIATVVGLVTLLFGASGVFGQLKDALNTIWEVEPKPGRSLLGTLKDRFLSFTMVLGTGFLLLVALVINSALAAFASFLKTLPGADILWQAVGFLVTLLVVSLMFALMFKFLPDVQVAWKDVAIGAVFTAVLFMIGQIILSIYLSIGNVGSSYGTAGSLVVVLVWIYYSAQIFLFGAEFTQVYARTYGSRVKPAADARYVTDEARAQQGIPRDNDTSDKPKAEPRRKPGKLTTSPWFK